MPTSTRRRRLLLAGLALLTAVPTLSLSPMATPSASAAPVPAARADAFVDSIGVNTHLNYTDRAYGDYPAWRDLLVQSGIRHVRDGINKGQGFVYDRMIELSQDAGIRWNLIMGRPWNGIWSSGGYTGDPLVNAPAGTIGELASTLATYANGRGRLLDGVASVEGANEYDNQGDGNWAANLERFSESLWGTVKGDARLRHLPVVGPSFVHADSRSRYAGLVGAGNLLDLGNMHSYTGGQQPTSRHLDDELALNGRVAGSKPQLVTETGYHTAVASGHDQPGVSEEVQALYLVRQYLENFRKGIPRTFEYEFLDEYATADGEGRFGLVRHTYEPKPAFHAVRNLIDLLEDPGAAVPPAGLSYRLTGGNDATRTVLLQKRDGRSYLAVWQETSAWDTGRRQRVDPADVPVTIALDQPVSRAALFVPTSGAAPTRTMANPSSVPLHSSEVATIVELTPAGTGPVPPPPTTTTTVASPTTSTTVPAGFAVRVNAGGPRYTDGQGRVWAADVGFQGGTVNIAYKAIAGTTDDPLYQSERWGLQGYRVAVPAAGTYRLRLHLAEVYFTSPGQRVFSAAAEGRPVLTGHDIVATAGALTAQVVEVPVTVTDGTLDLTFTRSVDNPTVAAIEVLGASGAPPPTTSTTVASPTTSTTVPAGFAVRVNAGGPRYTDGQGRVWAADVGFQGGTVNIAYKAIAGTTDDPLYQSERWGLQGYRVAVPAAGTYRLRLHLAEVYFTSPGQRVFSAAAEGRPVLTGHDIVATAGALTAQVVEVPVTVTDGTLDLTFTRSVDNPTVAALEVLAR